MKFSCDFNGIDYIFTTEEGQDTNDKYHLFLGGSKLSKFKQEQMKFYTLYINAKCDGEEMNFLVTGVPLSANDQEQMQELEDFFEARQLFEKIEDSFDLMFSEEKIPVWGNKDLI